ncbi:MAG: hypothetical protein GX596_01295 [Propionibacterium sp.]|nr:hypothetical protein [Propionibacterium sp.]
MSNQQWPPPGEGAGSPWASQDPSWKPQQFAQHEGRAPRQPFGAQQGGPSMPDLEPPKKRVWPWVVGIVAAIAVVLGVLFIQPGAPGPTASVQPPATAHPLPTVTGNALPYEGNGTGVFEVTAHRWTDSGLEIDYRITVDEGIRRFAFFAFDNATRESFLPDNDYLIEASPGSPATGTVHFSMPRAAASFVLTTGSGRAITALPISG